EDAQNDQRRADPAGLRRRVHALEDIGEPRHAERGDADEGHPDDQHREGDDHPDHHLSPLRSRNAAKAQVDTKLMRAMTTPRSRNALRPVTTAVSAAKATAIAVSMSSATKRSA